MTSAQGNSVSRRAECRCGLSAIVSGDPVRISIER